MGPDPSGFGFREGESEGVERLGRAKPDELVSARVDVDSERVGEAVADAAVDAVRGDDQIVCAPFGIVRVAFGFEAQLDAQFSGAILQDFEQPLAPNADEAVARRANGFTMDVDVDVVPMREFVGDDLGRDRVVGHEVVDRLVGKDHAPAEGHPARVALEHMDLVARIAQLHRDGEVHPGRPGTDAGDLH